jgi:hypothetical protein
MRVLVATTCSQGSRRSDFTLVFTTELVQLAPVCDRDGDDLDGPCGCRRAFIGIHTRRPVTTAAVTERDITPARYRSLLRHAIRTSRHPQTSSETDIQRLAEKTAAELERLAGGLPPGTVVERRGEDVLVRTWSPTAGQPREEPAPDRGEPRRDNGFVFIDFSGDDDVFPAWVSPYWRWNGFAVATFTRSVAARVVDWTNRLHAVYPDGAASAGWDGEDILLVEAGWDEDGPIRISPDEHGRYHIGDGWTWTEQRCWICHAPAQPGEDDGSAVLLHEPGCPTTPAEQWPLATHKPL